MVILFLGALLALFLWINHMGNNKRKARGEAGKRPETFRQRREWRNDMPMWVPPEEEDQHGQHGGLFRDHDEDDGHAEDDDHHPPFRGGGGSFGGGGASGEW